MRTFSIVAAHDTPTYGSFTVEAETPEAALAAAEAALLDDPSCLNEAEPESAHSLRIVALQEDDQDPLYCDVSLDPDAPCWPGARVRAALLSSTSVLAQLVASLGEASAYPGELDQLEANLRLMIHDHSGVGDLLAARAGVSPEDWAETVMGWTFECLSSGREAVVDGEQT